MLTTKFLVSAAATIATAGVIGVAIAQQTTTQSPAAEPQSPPSGSTSATTPATPSTNDSSSAATAPAASTGAVGSSVQNESTAKSDRN